MTSHSALDNPRLLQSLVAQAKSSHSAMGRSVDSNMAHRKLGQSIEPSAISRNRLERERQLRLQREHQSACRVAQDGTLVIPTLPTMAPSFTKAADEGVEALGGTKMEGPGYTSVMGLVPTAESVKCIEDDYELISSFRPYMHDALHAARQAAMRDTSSPHPDLLRRMEPALAEVCPTHLVDMKALPDDLLGTRTAAQAVELTQEAAPCDEDADGDGRAAPRGGTYPFVCQGRDPKRRRLPGVRQPCIGQYTARHGEIEPRVTGGYIAPRTSSAPLRRSEEPPATEPSSVNINVQRRDSGGGFGGYSSFYGTMSNVNDQFASTGNDDTSTVHKPGENVKGSSMFLSKSERKLERGSAAPDKSYWPYPDMRSTTSRVKGGPAFDVPQHFRRREPPVSGVPTGAYNVCKDIADMPQKTVRMATETGRDAHWYRKQKPVGENSADFGNVDAALQATRPNVKHAHLPPRVDPRTVSKTREGAGIDNTVSIERDPSFPPPMLGTREAVARVRGFGNMVGRGEGKPDSNLTRNLDYDLETHVVEPRSRGASIHPRAPGHGCLHNPNPNELGETPDLSWVKPSTKRTTHFGAGSMRPDHLLPFKDLTYNIEPGLRLIEPRVQGNPMIGTIVSRQSRDKVFAKSGCGPQVMYNGVDLPGKIKSVPLFEKQITKETQFCGHKIQSERWERNNPKAPGPGHYNVNYSLVETSYM